LLGELSKMESRSPNSGNPEAQQIFLQAKVEFQAHEIERLERELAKEITFKESFERDLNRIKNDLSGLETKVAVKDIELKNARDDISKYRKTSRKKNILSILLTILANLLFLLSTIVVGFGVNMLTSNPPNELGNTMLILGGSAYAIAAVMIVLLATLEGSRNEP
jgi:hypothetical protein